MKNSNAVIVIMSEEEKINQAIQHDGVNTQLRVLDELKRRYPQYVEPPTNGVIKRQEPKKYRKEWNNE